MKSRRNTPAQQRRRIKHTKFRCEDGPFAGQTISVASCGGFRTLEFTVKGETGWYIGGKWHARR